MHVIRLFICYLIFTIVLSACAYDNTPISEISSQPQEHIELPVVYTEREIPAEEVSTEPPAESHFRIITAEPEENAGNHLIGPSKNLYLKSAIYGEDITAEYYYSAELDDDGMFWFDSPTWTSLLVRKNDKVYPFISVAANKFVQSMVCGKDFETGYYTFWIITSGAGDLYFHEYNYDPEQDAYIETKFRKDTSHHHPIYRADLNHSLEEIHSGEITFGR